MNRKSVKNFLARKNYWSKKTPEERKRISENLIIALKKKVMERKRKKAIEDAIYWKSLD